MFYLSLFRFIGRSTHLQAGQIVAVLMLLILPSVNIGKTAGESYETQNVLLPVMSYSPETSLMFGGLAMVQFKPGNANSDTRSSRFIASGIYTLNRQLMVELVPDIILSEDRWMIEGRYEYAHFPQNFWGVGPETRNRDKIKLDYRTFGINQLILRNFGNSVYAGPKIRWVRVSDVSINDQADESVSASGINSVEGNTLAGIGLSVRNDLRNSIMTPTKGRYLEFTAMYYSGLAGTTYPHSSWLLDARYYLPLRDIQPSVLAFQFQSRFTTGDLPFQEYSLLGGREIMRGYYEGRFRDAHSAQVQAEFRRNVWWRFGLTLFASAGEVWQRFDEFSMVNPKFSAGAGIRFNFNPDDPGNLRIDYGIGQHGSGLYITIGEAF